MIVMLAAVAIAPTPASGAASPEIEVTPAVDLVDGQVVAVSGAGWAPGAVQVFQCVVTGSEVATACVYRRHVNVRDDGTFTTQIPVAARLWDETTGEVIDCRERTDCGIRMLSTAEIAIVEHPLALVQLGRTAGTSADVGRHPLRRPLRRPGDPTDRSAPPTPNHPGGSGRTTALMMGTTENRSSPVSSPARRGSRRCSTAIGRRGGPMRSRSMGRSSATTASIPRHQLDDGTPYDCSVGAGCVLLTGSYPDPLTHTTVPIRFGSSQTSTSTTQATTSTTSAAATAPTVQPRFTG